MRLANTQLSNKYFQMVMDAGETASTDYLLGYKTDKHKKVYQVENNLVNRMVLGIDEVPVLPEDLMHGKNLLSYQVADVKKIIGVPNCANFNKMGAGKTVETIVAMRELGVRNAVIIAPRTVIPQWIEQLKVWYPGIVNIVEYTKKVHLDKGTFVVLNYEKLMNNETFIALKKFAWDVLVVDEAHRIKNPKSQRSQNVASIPAVRKWALTGSPILNKPTDLFNILHFADWRYSGSSYWNFVYYFCETVYNGTTRRPVGLTKDPVKVAILNSLLKRVSVRNEIIVAEGRTVTTVKLPMSVQQRKLYDQVVNISIAELPEECTIANSMVLNTRLQQVTTCPAVFSEYSNVYGVKFDWILETCLDHPEEKFVVFSKYSKVIQKLTEFLNCNRVTTVRFTGDMHFSECAESKRRFIEESNVQVLAGTIGALGTGTDGLQHVCHLLIALDRDWSPELNAQMECRVDRYDQHQHVICYYLECEKSWDQHVGSVNMHKAADIRIALQEV